MRAKTMESARVIPVIETKTICGAGTEKDPVRFIVRYWGLDGRLLAEADDEAKNDFVSPAFPNLR